MRPVHRRGITNPYIQCLMWVVEGAGRQISQPQYYIIRYFNVPPICFELGPIIRYFIYEL